MVVSFGGADSTKPSEDLVREAAYAAGSRFGFGRPRVVGAEPHPWGWRRVWCLVAPDCDLALKVWSGAELGRLRNEASLALAATRLARRGIESPFVPAIGVVGWDGEAWRTLLDAEADRAVLARPSEWASCSRAASIYRYVGSRDVDARGPTGLELGAALAWFHALFADVPVEALPRWPSLAPGRHPILRAVRRELARAPAASASACVIHGDARLGNARRGSDGRVVLIDVEFCRQDSPLFDLAALVAPNRDEGGGFSIADPQFLADAITGYQSGPRAPLTDEQWDALPNVVLAHYANVALDLEESTEGQQVIRLLKTLLEQGNELLDAARSMAQTTLSSVEGP
jgi:hypothetical protein